MTDRTNRQAERRRLSDGTPDPMRWVRAQRAGLKTWEVECGECHSSPASIRLLKCVPSLAGEPVECPTCQGTGRRWLSWPEYVELLAYCGCPDARAQLGLADPCPIRTVEWLSGLTRWSHNIEAWGWSMRSPWSVRSSLELRRVQRDVLAKVTGGVR